MQIDLLTTKHLEDLKIEILNEIKQLFRRETA